MEYRYRLVIAYDGTDYAGWQYQDHAHSIAGVLQERFLKAFKKPIVIVGASRTDKGVHAFGQVASFKTDMVIDPQRLMLAWNRILDPGIVIRSLDRVDDSFNPMRTVLHKTYYYHIFQERPLPFYARYGWYYPGVDVQKLRDGLQIFVGTHDFRSFCTTQQGDTRSTIRTVHSIEVHEVPQGKTIRVAVTGHSFLHYMVRRMVGAAAQVAVRSDLSRVDLERALAEKNPQQTLVKAPACGLMLYNVTYQDGTRSCRYPENQGDGTTLFGHVGL